MEASDIGWYAGRFLAVCSWIELTCSPLPGSLGSDSLSLSFHKVGDALRCYIIELTPPSDQTSACILALEAPTAPRPLYSISSPKVRACALFRVLQPPPPFLTSASPALRSASSACAPETALRAELSLGSLQKPHSRISSVGRARTGLARTRLGIHHERSPPRTSRTHSTPFTWSASC